MIHDATQLIVNQLDNKLKNHFGSQTGVKLGNIAQLDTDPTKFENKVITTMVNIEEEAALKNGPSSSIINGKVVYQNRPVHLYAYLLFTAVHSNYSTSLKYLEFVVKFFQGNNVFTALNSPVTQDVGFTESELAKFRVTLELFSLTFEQINHLWGSLGGKQSPFVLYRARLLEVDADVTLASGPRMEELKITSNLK